MSPLHRRPPCFRPLPRQPISRRRSLSSSFTSPRLPPGLPCLNHDLIAPCVRPISCLLPLGHLAWPFQLQHVPPLPPHPHAPALPILLPLHASLPHHHPSPSCVSTTMQRCWMPPRTSPPHQMGPHSTPWPSCPDCLSWSPLPLRPLPSLPLLPQYCRLVSGPPNTPADAKVKPRLPLTPQQPPLLLLLPLSAK